MSLGHGILDASALFPVALPDGFDATRWKLLKCDVSGTYRIVNQHTGKLLAQDSSGIVVCGVDDGVSLGQQWLFIPPAPPSQSTTPASPIAVPSLPKEVPIQNS